jgi:hypothetical protein
MRFFKRLSLLILLSLNVDIEGFFFVVFVIQLIIILPLNIANVLMIVDGFDVDVIRVLPHNIANARVIIDGFTDVGLIRVSSYLALRRCLGITVTGFSPNEVSERVIIRVVSHFLLNFLICGIPLFYNDVSCIDDFVQLRISEFVLI